MGKPGKYTSLVASISAFSFAFSAALRETFFMLAITQAESETQITDVRKLFREYELWLGLDLCFQGFEAELATLPGKYAMPDGRLYLAYSDDSLAGCIALRKLEDGVCEMKRLFVREDFRGAQIGVRLIERLIANAREIGYEKMRLDTYPAKMAKAVKLYESHGFVSIPPYYNNPHDGVLFMELAL
jgi:GNAT superfamily N-acetyltransferase